MRATQIVRRGLIAFAAVATLSVGLSGVASAQHPAAFPENSPGAVIDANDGSPIVYAPIPGYSYGVVSAEGARSAILAVGVTGGQHPVVVQFLPDFTGAAIIDPVAGNVIAADAAAYAADLLAELGG